MKEERKISEGRFLTREENAKEKTGGEEEGKR